MYTRLGSWGINYTFVGIMRIVSRLEMDLSLKRLMDDASEPSNGVIDSRVSCSPSSADYTSFYLDIVQCTFEGELGRVGVGSVT